METEDQLIILCDEYLKSKKIQSSSEPVRHFFWKLINSNDKLELTPRIRVYIPMLAQIDNGALCSFLLSHINGLSPTDFVPDLNLMSSTIPQEPSDKKSSRAPRRGNKKGEPQTYRTKISPRLQIIRSKPTIEALAISEITFPKSARTPRRNSEVHLRNTKRSSRTKQSPRDPLPPLTLIDSDILDTLRLSSNNDVFIGKKLDDKSLHWSIVPPSYPPIKPEEDFSILSRSSVVTIHSNECSSVQSLDQFVRDQTNEFLLENHMIRLRANYRCFYTWRERYRDKLFSKIISLHNQHLAISYPSFDDLLFQIRIDVLNVTSKAVLFPQSFDQINDEVDFSDLKSFTNSSVESINKEIEELKSQIGKQIAGLFTSIKAANIMIQLGFEELHSLNQLPPSLQKFASDLKWKVPSLWREKMREKQLRNERKLATNRLNYLGTFFSKIRIQYNGQLVLQCKRVMIGFLDRFLEKSQYRTRLHRIVANFHETKGLELTPTVDEFINWMNDTLSAIRATFFRGLNSDWNEIIYSIDPNYQYNIENPNNVLSRFKDLENATDQAIASVRFAYKGFMHELGSHAECICALERQLVFAKNHRNIRDISTVKKMIENLISKKEDLDRRPKSVFHRRQNNSESQPDFIVDLRPACDVASQRYSIVMVNLRKSIQDELNNIFNEINDPYSMKERKITRNLCINLETLILQYSILCGVLIEAWPDSISDLKASLDSVMRVYRQQIEKCKYRRPEIARQLNDVADLFSIANVSVFKSEEEEYSLYEEEEYYEEEEGSDVPNN